MPTARLPTGDAIRSIMYAAEDELVAIFKESLQRLQTVAFEHPPVYHAYPHPKSPQLSRDRRQR